MKKLHYLLLIFFFSLNAVYGTGITDTYINQHELLQSVLSSIVIIDSERVAYTNPYDVQTLSSLFFPTNNFQSEIHNAQGNGISNKKLFGSGVILKVSNTTYYILTNHHVIENSSSIWVTTYDGFIHEGTIVGSDTHRDIAVISISSTNNYPAIQLASNQSIKVGTPIYVIGSPYGFMFSVSKGIISATNRTDSILNNIFIQTDAAMNPGNSGGALIDNSGKLLGISTWIYSPKSSVSVGINFASTINIAKKIADNIINNQEIEYGWIGITYDSFSPPILNEMGISYRFGSIITNIVLDSPAHRANLHIGDIILDIENNEISAFSSLHNNTSALISTLAIDTLISISVQRQNNIKTIDVLTEKNPISDVQMTTIASRIWPGMTIIPIEYYKKEMLGLSDDKDVLLVKNIIDNTFATQSNIKINDVITLINNKNATYQNYLEIINNALKTKEPIELEIFTAGTFSQEILYVDK